MGGCGGRFLLACLLYWVSSFIHSIIKGSLCNIYVCTGSSRPVFYWNPPADFLTSGYTANSSKGSLCNNIYVCNGSSRPVFYWNTPSDFLTSGYTATYFGKDFFVGGLLLTTTGCKKNWCRYHHHYCEYFLRLALFWAVDGSLVCHSEIDFMGKFCETQFGIKKRNLVYVYYE